MTYNQTQYNWGTSFNDLLLGINSSTNGLFSIIFLFLIYFIIFVSFKSVYDTKIVFLISNFATTIIGVLFLIAGYISLNILLVPIGLLAISILIIGFT